MVNKPKVVVVVKEGRVEQVLSDVEITYSVQDYDDIYDEELPEEIPELLKTARLEYPAGPDDLVKVREVFEQIATNKQADLKDLYDG
jgi:hypothetical protein